jgi:pyruvate/2-oxoglutarate dehydrogenase complex dihydrolipoamide dehydrogenase (E3) component
VDVTNTGDRVTRTTHYRLLVVGGGKAGKTLAMDRARAGWRVAMVEQAPEMIGGTCINLPPRR